MDMEENIVTRRDSELLLLILPAEIWHIISNKMKYCSNDLEILANSSPFFGQLLVPLKTNFLFLKVIQIVSPKIWNRKEKKKKRQIKEVLNWRQVSPQWNIAVDTLLWKGFTFFKSRSLNEAFKSRLVNTCTKTPNVLSKFLSHFEETHPGVETNDRSPFIGPKLILLDFNIRDQLFNENVSTLLNRYGIYVKSVLIFCVSIGFGNVQLNWLSKLPNLVSLVIVKHPIAIDLEGDESQRFPEFVNLQKLACEGLPLPLLNNLVQTNSHIESLTLRKYGVEVKNQISAMHLPNLKHFIVVKNGCCDNTEQQVRQIMEGV